MNSNADPRGKGLALGLIGCCHWIMVPYALLAWIWPNETWLILHLIFVPGLVLQWQLNGGVCILNNLESWLRTGRWRDEQDAHQGGWIESMVVRYTGITLSQRLLTALTYGLLALSWGASLYRLITD